MNQQPNESSKQRMLVCSAVMLLTPCRLLRSPWSTFQLSRSSRLKARVGLGRCSFVRSLLDRSFEPANTIDRSQEAIEIEIFAHMYGQE